MTIFQELKRRNVIRVALAYIVAAWLLVSVADLILEVIGAESWVLQAVVALSALGFVPAVIFSWAFEMTPEGIKKESEVNRGHSITQHTAKKLDMVTIGLLVAAIAFVALDRFIPKTMAPGIASDSNSTETPVAQAKSEIEPELIAIPAKSIAVLPFVNMSADQEQEYFADGISEEILNALARVDELKVAGRTSSFAFKGQNQDLKTIGEALRVSHILEGSVRKAGNQLRITAQLIKVDDGYHLWSETYDRELVDIFAIQDEISNAILRELKAKLGVGQTIATTEADPQAYAQYLLAKQRIYERSQASMELAADLLSQATVRDPNFAAAYAQLGIATILLSERQYGTQDHQQAYSLGRQYLEKALEIDPEQAEAMAGMGLYQGVAPGGNEEEIRWLRKSLASDPSQVNASNWLARSLNEIGQARESMAIREQDFARDPLYMPVFSNLVQGYAKRGQFEQAERVLADLDPYLHDDANMTLTRGMVYQFAGRWADANKSFTAAYLKEPQNFVNRGWLSTTLISMGDYERCEELCPPGLKTLALSRLGRHEEGLMLGAEAVGRGAGPNWYIQALVENGRYQDVVDFVESRWTDLAAFDKAFPERNGFGAWAMALVAESYGQVDNLEKFDEALSLARSINEQGVTEGLDNHFLNGARAQVAVLAGDYDSAITLLERAFGQGLVMDLTAPEAWPVFKPLWGDPRFETAKSQMLERLNYERAQVDLDSLST